VILAGDIGGTKTVLALCGDALAIAREATYPCADYPSLEAIVDEFLTPADRAQLTGACFGVAGPVVENAAKITNLPWTIAGAALSQQLGGIPVALLNDLQATALGCLVLPASAFAVLQPGASPAGPAPGATIAVIAPGTGLGEALLIADGGRYRALPSEAGHADFAPGSDEEIELLRYLRRRHGDHVSCERVLSGAGISDLYDFVRSTRTPEALGLASGSNPEIAFPPAVALPDQRSRIAEIADFAAADRAASGASATDRAIDRNAAISRAGLEGSDPAAVHALELFAEILGAEAGNLALRGFATGGVVIGGGIPPKILPALQQPGLVQRFRAKGRFAAWMNSLSVRVALEPRAALLGAAHHAASHKDPRA
jgi:glucokinase